MLEKWLSYLVKSFKPIRFVETSSKGCRGNGCPHLTSESHSGSNRTCIFTPTREDTKVALD